MCRGNVILTEGSNEAVQPRRFSLKEVESDSNVNDRNAMTEKDGMS